MYRYAFRNGAAAFVALGYGLAAPLLPAQTTRTIRPLQTELIQPLDLTHVKVGATVFARVDVGWTDADCALKAGSMVKGRIVDMTKRLKGEKNSAVQLVFEQPDCKDAQESALRFTLVALIGMQGGGSSTGQSGVSEGPPLSSNLPQAIGGSGGGIRNADIASSLTDGLPIPAVHLPSKIQSGEVVNLPRIRLGIGSGPVSATTVTAVGRDLRLEAGTVLVLLPAALEIPANEVAQTGEAKRFHFSATGGGGGSMAPDAATATVHKERLAPPPPEPVEAPDETEICSGACTVVDRTERSTNAQATSSLASIKLDTLGYKPNSSRELAHFGADTTVTFLDERTLLCTFDPHFLRERTGANEDASRTIRAVLIDPAAYIVRRVLDWHVRGEGQYLWPLSSGRIIIHMRHELREFSADLRPLRSIPLTGRLAWVSTSPSGDFIAVGTIEELYSAKVRQELQQTLADEPEESVVVRVFDEGRHMLLSGIRSSKTPVPVLTDTGELRVHAERGYTWKLSEIRWDRTEHAIADIRSTCRPTLSALQNNLIFALGCNSYGGHWYRILRVNGRTLLKGDSPSTEIEQGIQGLPTGNVAVRTVQTVRSMDYSQPFRPSDLSRQTIDIYSGANGTHLAGITSTDFAYSKLAFALSPKGDQIALAGRNAIQFYKVK